MISESMTAGGTISRAKRLKAEAMRKAVASTVDTQTRVMDPDVPSIDRTPVPLLKPQFAVKGLAKRAAEHRTNQQVSTTASQSSRMQMENVFMMESSVSSDRNSGNTPEESLYEESESRSMVTGKQNEMTSDARGSIAQRSSRSDRDMDEAPATVFKKEWTVDQRREWVFAPVTITLSEVPVVMLYSRGDEVVNKEKSESENVIKRNERYTTYCENRRKDQCLSRYSEHSTTTLNNPKKSVKSLVASPATKNSGGIHVTPWKLYDEYLKLNAEEEIDDVKVTNDPEKEPQDAEENDEGGDEDQNSDEETELLDAGRHVKNSWLLSDTLLENVLVMERAVVMNTFEELQLAYRGLEMPVLKDHLPQEAHIDLSPKLDRRKQANEIYGVGFLDTQADKKEEEARERERNARERAEAEPERPVHYGKMRELWKFNGQATKGKSVTCIGWNKVNPDILAAGYGNCDDTKLGGVVCCWTLKNPIAPERVIQLQADAGVSSVSFSEQHPSLLAVGSTDGTLALYDVRRHGNSPALKTSVSTGQHTGIIWEVQWISKGVDRGENLMSVSADGHVMEWSIKKGLERTADLMKLKRAQKSGDGGNIVSGKNSIPKEALLSRQSGGMTFDINPKDLSIYVVGTEDGTIHKCSKSQNENYIMDYKPHEEPVYRLRWSPFCSQYFLTCSADWTSRLYHVDQTDPLLKLDSNNQDAVYDISWSHTCCTTFATATAQGRVQIWDISDPQQPKATHEIEGQSLSCVLFAQQESPVVVAGDTRGDITILKLNGTEFERGGLTNQEQKERFLEVVQKVAL